MKKLLILMLLGVLFVPMNGSAKADEVLYCVSELATGMARKNDTWVTGSFQSKRYTINVTGTPASMSLLAHEARVLSRQRDGLKWQPHSPYLTDQ